MESIWSFKIDAQYLEEKGDVLCNTISKWLKQNNCEDVLVYTFVVEDEFGSLIVDYNSNRSLKNMSKLLVGQLLKHFDVEYSLE